MKEQVVTLLQQDTDRRAKWEERIESLLEKSIDTANTDRREFMAFVREQVD